MFWSPFHPYMTMLWGTLALHSHCQHRTTGVNITRLHMASSHRIRCMHIRPPQSRHQLTSTCNPYTSQHTHCYIGHSIIFTGVKC
jgi:hypothetical protein